MKRPDLKARHPVHVTMKLRGGLPNLRHRRLAALVLRAFHAAKKHADTRIVQFSIQSKHLHLLVEATSKSSLSRAVGGLAVRVARGRNRRVGRRGSVFADRFHSRALRTPLEVRRALVYVLKNHLKHTHPGGRTPLFDPLSSAPYFDGFSTPMPAWFRHPFAAEDPPVSSARTWLLRLGWRRSGPLWQNEVPA